MEKSIVWKCTLDGDVHSNLFEASEVTSAVRDAMEEPGVVEVLVSTVSGSTCYGSKFSRDPVLGAMFPTMYPKGWNRDFYTYPASQF